MRTQSISHRLAIGFSAVVLIFVGILLTESFNAKQVEKATERMAREAELLKLADQWLADVRQNSARSLAVANSSGGDMLAFFKEDMAATSRSTTETQKAFLALALSERSKEQAAAVGKVRLEWLAARDEINQLKAAGRDEEARAQVTARFVPITQKYVGVTQALADGQMAQVRNLEEEVSKRFARFFWTAGLLGTLGVIVAAVMCTRIVRTIRDSIGHSVSVAQQLGRGDLTQVITVQGTDELSQLLLALKDAQAQLRSLVERVRVSSESIAHASHEVAAGNMDLSARTEQAASNLQQTAASMEQMSAAIKSSASNARQANDLVDQASALAHAGGSVVGEVVNTMQEISESSSRISDIIGTIDAIAFQTNILALNAAVEAARAGEQGRGFAVVAGEVRTLAGRAAQAAREIKSLISTSVERVERGTALVEKTGSSMQNLVESVVRIQQMVSGMAAAAAQQSDGAAQINRAVANLDQMTQQNAALVEQGAAAASSLKDQSASLIAAVSAFKVGTPTR